MSKLIFLLEGVAVTISKAISASVVLILGLRIGGIVNKKLDNYQKEKFEKLNKNIWVYI